MRLVAMVVLVAVDQFLRLRKNPGMGRAIGYGLSLALVAYTHYAPAGALTALLALLAIQGAAPAGAAPWSAPRSICLTTPRIGSPA